MKTLTMTSRLVQLVVAGVLMAANLLYALPAPVSAGLALPSTADYGDAPDSTNLAAKILSAYPGVDGYFPTIFDPAASSAAGQGPKHINATIPYVLGRGVSAEWLAESGLDHDGVPNLDLVTPQVDQDGRDDGFKLPANLPHCKSLAMQVVVTVRDAGQTFPQQAFVNLWMDFDRGGRWGGAYTCPGAVLANEWTVQNHSLTFAGPGEQVITLPAAIMWYDKPNQDMWVRVTLSNEPAAADDGSGPKTGYAHGETEDYLLEGLGDPPESQSIPPLQVSDLAAVIPPPIIQLPLVAVPPGPWSPDEWAAPSGNLTEVDMAHIGGAYQSPTPPFAVTVAGTGWSARMMSWNLGNPLGAPTMLQQGPVRIGHDHQIHVLTPPLSPKLDHEMFVTGLLRDDTLWLTTWRLEANGAFSMLDTRGYGPQAGVKPQHYTMAHRAIEITQNSQRFQLVTPILHDNGTLRFVTWEVNGITGTINGRGDSGDVTNNVLPTSDMSATWVEGDGGFVPQHYIASLIAKGGEMMNSLWYVDNAGVPDLRGLALSGRDIQNANNLTVLASDVAIAPLNDEGYISAANVGSGPNQQLRMHTWEELTTSCNAEDGCEMVPSNISDNTQDLMQAGIGVVISAPSITTNRAFLYDPIYDDALFTKNENTVQAIASVRKVMVELVTLDEIAAGNVSLDDQVTISAAAAGVNNTGASATGLQQDEVISLRDLLNAMMMVSAGDATWAISEHVGGDLDGMVDMMNDKAVELGLTDTLYCRNPASNGFSSVGYSTAEDQARLWASAWDNIEFINFAGEDSADVCGTLPGGAELCHPAIPPMTKDMDNYPNIDGWKTGGGGGLCTGNGALDALSTCPSGGCLSIQTTRLDRPLVLSALQPSGMPANRWPDAYTLYDYGFRRIFTPDFVQTSGNQAGSATDFALDYVNDAHSATATINGGKEMIICNWETFVDLGVLTKRGCTTVTISGLPAGTDAPPPTRLDMVRISTLEAEGDYLLGRMDGLNLVLRLWRVGEKDF